MKKRLFAAFAALLMVVMCCCFAACDFSFSCGKSDTPVQVSGKCFVIEAVGFQWKTGTNDAGKEKFLRWTKDDAKKAGQNSAQIDKITKDNTLEEMAKLKKEAYKVVYLEFGADNAFKIEGTANTIPSASGTWKQEEKAVSTTVGNKTDNYTVSGKLLAGNYVDYNANSPVERKLTWKVGVKPTMNVSGKAFVNESVVVDWEAGTDDAAKEKAVKKVNEMLEPAKKLTKENFLVEYEKSLKASYEGRVLEFSASGKSTLTGDGDGKSSWDNLSWTQRDKTVMVLVDGKSSTTYTVSGEKLVSTQNYAPTIITETWKIR